MMLFEFRPANRSCVVHPAPQFGSAVTDMPFTENLRRISSYSFSCPINWRLPRQRCLAEQSSGTQPLG